MRVTEIPAAVAVELARLRARLATASFGPMGVPLCRAVEREGEMR